MPKRKRKKRRSKNKSGFIGVEMVPSGRFSTKISINRKNKYLGTYDTAKRAAKAYDKEAIKLRRPISKLNFPKEAHVGYTPVQQTLRSDNTIGYRGAYKHGKKFQAYTDIAGKRTYHGTYDTAHEAAVAYDRAVLKANKSTTLLNFPDMVHNLDVEPKRKKKSGKISGKVNYRGVSKSGKKFRAQISINGKVNYLGIFPTETNAALAYDAAAIKAGKDESKLNFKIEKNVVYGTGKDKNSF